MNGALADVFLSGILLLPRTDPSSSQYYLYEFIYAAITNFPSDQKAGWDPWRH